jgi:hypothetical protein
MVCEWTATKGSWGEWGGWGKGIAKGMSKGWGKGWEYHPGSDGNALMSHSGDYYGSGCEKGGGRGGWEGLSLNAGKQIHRQNYRRRNRRRNYSHRKHSSGSQSHDSFTRRRRKRRRQYSSRSCSRRRRATQANDSLPRIERNGSKLNVRNNFKNQVLRKDTYRDDHVTMNYTSQSNIHCNVQASLHNI